MKIALRLFFFFFLSTVLFGQMFRMDPVETDPRVKAASDLRRQQYDDEASEGDSASESDDSGAVQRGATAGISEKPPVAYPVNNSTVALQNVDQQKAEARVIDLADVIDYLRINNLLGETKDKLRESVNIFLDQQLDQSQELDENEKASIKSQQAKIMADDLERRGEEALVASSLVRHNTLTLLERSLDNAGSKIRSTREKHAALLVALREIASSTPQSGREDAASTAQKSRFLMSRTEAVQANEHASIEAPIVSRSMAPSTAPSITDTKFALEQNRLALEQLPSNDSFQEEARELQAVMRKKHAEFLLEESISNKAAEAKAKENKEFFNKKIKELEEIKASGRSEVAVHAPIMEQLDKIIQGLRTRSEAYQQLETIYQDMPHEERASLLQLLKSEQASSSSTSVDKRILLGNHGRMRVEEAPLSLENVDSQHARDGMKLASLEILKRFGPYALHRFNNFFHTEMMDPAPLAVEKLKEFVKSEEQRELTRTSGFKSLFLTKDLKGIEVLNRIYQQSLDPAYKGSEQERRDQEALICLDGSQISFNPFAVNKFSKKYLVEEGKMAHGGVLGIEEALRNGEIEFAKNMTALKRHDVANDFFEKYNDPKNPLTVSALASFFKVESEKQERWPDRLYYACFSRLYDKLPEQYQINRQGWSIFQAIVSAVKGQPVITQLGKEVGLPLWNTDISTTISVVMTWGTTWLGDETRPSRKPPVIDKENLEEGSSKKNYDLREAADEFYDSTVATRLHYLLNSGNVEQALQQRRSFVNNWIERRPDLGQVDINADEKAIDAAFPKLGKDIEDSITDAHQKIESQGKEIKHSHYFSAAETEALQASFKERQAEFLSLEAKLPQGLQGMEHIWHSLKTSSDFFSEQAAEIKAKIEGGTKRLTKVDDLEQLAQHVTNIQEAYDQLADAYLLKYKLQKREQQKLETQKGKIVIQRPPFFEEIEKLLQADSSIAVDLNKTVNLSAMKSTTAEARKETLALIQVFLENGYGLDAVRRFNENFSLRAAERFITVEELRNFIDQEKEILQQKGVETRSIYLPSSYSESDLYHAPDSENDKVIRSNGRNFFYNSFLSKELPKDYLVGERSTAEEGVKHALGLLVKMDFFKKVNSVNQQEILWSYEKQFQGKGSKPLTVGAFKKFVEEETNKSQQWSSRLYYTIRNPSVIRVLWSTVMSALSGYRYQPGFEHLEWEDKFGVTYVTDVGYERYGNYREQESYEKHIAEMIKQMTASPGQPLPIDDAYFKLQQIESDRKNASDKNYIAWRVAVYKYAEKAEEIKKLKAAINSSSLENAFDSLEASQSSITKLSDDFEESPIFSKKDLAKIQKSVANFKEKFLLQQSRSAYDEAEVEMTQFMAANNAMLFQQQASEIEAKSVAAKREMKLLGKESDLTLLSDCAVLDNLATYLKQLHSGYDQLANAYAAKLLPARLKVKEEGADDLAQHSFHLNSNERSFLDQGQNSDVISSSLDAKLIITAKPKGVPSEKEKEKEKQAYRRGINLVELSLHHLYDDDVVQEFQRRFQIKRMQGNPLHRGELRDFLASLKEKGIKESFYLAPGHSVEQLLNPSYKSAEGIIKARKMNATEPIDEVQEGGTKALSELEKTSWYEGLTGLQKNRVLEKFKEKYVTPNVIIIPWKKWMGYRDPEHLEPLTAGALRAFVDEQKQINENWWLYYKILDTPATAVATWNLVTGAAVLARINNDVVRCHPTITLTTHFFGLTFPQYVLHVSCLALLPTPLHLLPSLAIAYASNYGGEQFNKERQLPLRGISQQANLYRLKQVQLRERDESRAVSVN